MCQIEAVLRDMAPGVGAGQYLRERYHRRAYPEQSIRDVIATLKRWLGMSIHADPFGRRVEMLSLIGTS